MNHYVYTIIEPLKYIMLLLLHYYNFHCLSFIKASIIKHDWLKCINALYDIPYKHLINSNTLHLLDWKSFYVQRIVYVYILIKYNFKFYYLYFCYHTKSIFLLHLSIYFSASGVCSVVCFLLINYLLEFTIQSSMFFKTSIWIQNR